MTEELVEGRTENSSFHVKEPRNLPNYAYAGFWMRGYAFLVDLIIISCLTKIFILGSFDLNPSGKVYLLAATIIYLGYFILMTKYCHGQTLGKMIFGLQVISLTEEKMSWQTVLIREGACRYLLKATLLIGYLLTIFTGKKQHLGDILSDTSVVTLNIVQALEQQEG